MLELTNLNLLRKQTNRLVFPIVYILLGCDTTIDERIAVQPIKGERVEFGRQVHVIVNDYLCFPYIIYTYVMSVRKYHMLSAYWLTT